MLETTTGPARDSLKATPISRNGTSGRADMVSQLQQLLTRQMRPDSPNTTAPFQA